MHAIIALPTACGNEASLKVEVSNLPQHIQDALMLHGLKQKVADAVANAGKEGWTKEVSYQKCQDVVDSLMAGTWAKKGGGARITNLNAYMDSEANKAAKLRYAKDQKLATAPSYFTLATDAERIAHIFKAFRSHEVLMAKWSKEWAARQEAKAVEIDLSDVMPEEDKVFSFDDYTREDLEQVWAEMEIQEAMPEDLDEARKTAWAHYEAK